MCVCVCACMHSINPVERMEKEVTGTSNYHKTHSHHWQSVCVGAGGHIITDYFNV